MDLFVLLMTRKKAVVAVQLLAASCSHVSSIQLTIIDCDFDRPACILCVPDI